MADGIDRTRVAVVTIGVGVVLLLGIGVALFSFGEDLFGSDAGTIDAYNSETLDSCEVPVEAVRIRRFVASIDDVTGRTFRSLTDVYASPERPDRIAAVLDVDVGYDLTMPTDHACRFGVRPAIWIVAVGEAPPEFWDGEHAAVVSDAPMPADARTLFRLRVAQAVEEGVFD